MASYSLVRRFIVGAVLWSAALLILGAVLLSWIYRQAVYQGFDDTLEGTTSVLIAFIETNKVGDILDSNIQLDARYQTAFSGYYWVIASVSENNTIKHLSNSRSLYEGTISVDQNTIKELANQPGPVRHFGGRGPFNEPLRIAARSVFLPDRVEPVIVIASADRRPVDKIIRRFSIITSWTLAGFTLALVIAVVYQVRFGLSPLFKLKQAIVDIRNGKTDRIAGQYPSEIEPLAHELNSLIEYNRQIVERARTHVGNLAHALKTPLSILLNEIDHAPKMEHGLAQIVEKQTQIMARQVDHHLNKARAATRATKIGSRTNITIVVSEILRTLTKIYHYKSLNLVQKGDELCFFRGEKQDFEEIIGNLLDNAYKWAKDTVVVEWECIECSTKGKNLKAKRVAGAQSEKDSKIIFEKKLGPDKKLSKEQRYENPMTQSDKASIFVRLSVEDNGPGLPEKHLETVLKRGERLDEKQPGSGLGLSIVKGLTYDYGGHLILEKSRLGGLKVSVFLPAVF